MKRWTPGQLQAVGYMLGTIGALLVTVVVISRPRGGLGLLAVAVVLVAAGAVAIWLAQVRRGDA